MRSAPQAPYMAPEGLFQSLTNMSGAFSGFRASALIVSYELPDKWPYFLMRFNQRFLAIS